MAVPCDNDRTYYSVHDVTLVSTLLAALVASGLLLALRWRTAAKKAATPARATGIPAPAPGARRADPGHDADRPRPPGGDAGALLHRRHRRRPGADGDAYRGV